MKDLPSIEKFLFQDSQLFSEEMTEFLQKTIFVMPTWKWAFLGSALALGVFILRPALHLILRELKKHNPIIKKHPNTFWGHFLKTETDRPLAWILTILIWFAIGDALTLPAKFGSYYDHFMRGLIAIFIIRLVYYAVDALCMVIADYTSKTPSTFDDQLVPFASKALKILVIVLGFLTVLQSFGLNVMSLLAGLGLGGLALALAAQDTAANLFGSITILFDRPFQVGDWVKIKDTEGTVEEIGFRSTRLRTFYNSLITIPNSIMAKENIDNMGARPARRVRQTLGLTYETSPEKIEEFCDRVRYLIKTDEKVIPETAIVHFNNYNASSLDVLVNFHLRVYTGPEELAHQQKIFIEILKIAAELKVDFAYPTQTVYYHGTQS